MKIAAAALLASFLTHAWAHADTGRAVYLVLRLGERRLYVLEDGDTATRRLGTFPVAIGKKGYETPTGRFQVQEKIANPEWVQFDWSDLSRIVRRVPPGPANPLGLRWIGFTTAYGLDIGFHGTPNTSLLGQAVSHGCVRMRNSDVVRLYDLVRVGTTVIVRP